MMRIICGTLLSSYVASPICLRQITRLPLGTILVHISGYFIGVLLGSNTAQMPMRLPSSFNGTVHRWQNAFQLFEFILALMD